MSLFDYLLRGDELPTQPIPLPAPTAVLVLPERSAGRRVMLRPDRGCCPGCRVPSHRFCRPDCPTVDPRDWRG